MTLNKTNFNINSTFLISLVFGFFPISFIFGNLIININIILFCCLGIFYLRSKIFTTKLDLLIKIIFLFFFIILFSTCLNFFKSLYLQENEYSDLVRLVKSITFFRFFLTLLIAYLLSKLDVLNFKYFFLSAAFIAILVSLDVIYQYITGVDFVGYQRHGIYHSGFFDDEYIAGGFIQNFSFFSIFFVTHLLKNKKNFTFIFTMLVICVLGLGIIFSGNRMPLILFLLGLFLIFLFNDKLKKTIISSLLILSVIFGTIFSFDEKIKYGYLSYYKNAQSLLLSIFTPQENDNLKIATEEEKKIVTSDFESFWVKQREWHGHRKFFFTALDVWGKNKIFGNGIKSFREECKKFMKHRENRLCSNHPHNYYLEILTDTGILGALTILAFGLLFIIFIIKNFKFFKDGSLESLFLSAATISLIMEVFPFRSSGSIFTTGNTTYLILIISIVVSYNRLLAAKNFK